MAAHKDVEEDLIRFIPDLRAFARTFYRDPSRADDLVQEAILKAWSNIDKFERGTNLKAWLFTILRNTFLSEMRKKSREVEDADGKYAAQLAKKPEQEAVLEYDDFRRAMTQIPDDQREALILVGASGFSYDEAAAICGCATGTVKSRVNRARKKLAELMQIESVHEIGTTGVWQAALSGGPGRRNVA